MRYDIYHAAVVGHDRNIYDFTSDGPKGKILKRVLFAPTERPEIFNLVLSDVLNDNTTVTDQTITDNGDRNKVLATVAKIIDMFSLEHPEHWIYARGNTAARTRLYRMAISLNLKELNKKYEIRGTTNGEDLEPFSKGRPYVAFLFKRKN